MMLTEIQNLLISGAPTESNLINLDRSLEAKIKELRAKIKKEGPAAAQPEASLKLNSTGGAINSDAMSQGGRS